MRLVLHDDRLRVAVILFRPTAAISDENDA